MPHNATAHAETLGRTILSLLEAMGPFRRKGERILADAGIAEVDPNAWYPLATWVAVLRTIEKQIGPKTLERAGRKIAEHADLPPGVDTFEKLLAGFGIAYGMNNRGPNAGSISCTVLGDRRARIQFNTPYPCEFERGVVQGFFSNFRDPNARLLEMEHTDGCRDSGGASCAYALTW